MKRIIKKSNKRGFTLLEVMLATVIMTIVSVMIMKGFISTMNYAHNNNVYNKMGAKNYDNAIGKVTTGVGYGKGDGLQKRINALKTDGKAGKVEIKKVTGGGGVAANTFSVKTWEFSDNTGVNMTGRIDNYSAGLGNFGESSSVSHRHSFFFQPTIVTCGGGEDHKVRYCTVASDSTGKSDGWYCVTAGCSKANTKLG